MNEFREKRGDSKDRPKTAKNNGKIAAVLDKLGHLRYFIVLEGIAVGAFGGAAAVLFRYGLEKVSVVIPFIISKSEENPWVAAAWFLVLAIAALVTRLLVFAEPMIGCGLCLGREGPSVQIGAMAGKGISRITGRKLTEERLLITCGASAGLAAAFNAPLAGAIFALEEIHKNYSMNVLLPALAASVTSDMVSRKVFGMAPVFDFSGSEVIGARYFWVILLMAVLIGAVGVCYNKCIAAAQDIYDIIGRKKAGGYLRTLVPFMCCGVLTFVLPVVLGGGSSLVMDVSYGLSLKMLAILLAVRFIYSIISFASGVPGGIFLPLLTLGALCGGVTHGLASMAGIDISLPGLVAVAMAAAFAAIVRSPVTGIVLMVEMTGDLELLLFMAAAALVSYMTADLLGAEPVYDQLLQRILIKREQITTLGSGKKVYTEVSVELGSKACGQKIKDMQMPEGCLIVNLIREGREIIPGGDMVIEPLDKIVAVCMANQLHRVQHMLENRCRVRL